MPRDRSGLGGLCDGSERATLVEAAGGWPVAPFAWGPRTQAHPQLRRLTRLGPCEANGDHHYPLARISLASRDTLTDGEGAQNGHPSARGIRLNMRGVRRVEPAT